MRSVSVPWDHLNFNDIQGMNDELCNITNMNKKRIIILSLSFFHFYSVKIIIPIRINMFIIFTSYDVKFCYNFI